jgi:adenosine kinase
MADTGLGNPTHPSIHLHDRLGRCQIGSFYTGAMAEARHMELQPIAERAGGLDPVVISPNDRVAMLRHTDECGSRRFNFVADPSQQMAWLDGPDIKRLIDGATYLFSNDYEDGLITQKTGWSQEEILERVAVRVITRGAKGSSVLFAGESQLDIRIAREAARIDPTGPAMRTARDSLQGEPGTCRLNGARR